MQPSASYPEADIRRRRFGDCLPCRDATISICTFELRGVFTFSVSWSPITITRSLLDSIKKACSYSVDVSWLRSFPSSLDQYTFIEYWKKYDARFRHSLASAWHVWLTARLDACNALLVIRSPRRASRSYFTECAWRDLLAFYSLHLVARVVWFPSLCGVSSRCRALYRVIVIPVNEKGNRIRLHTDVCRLYIFYLTLLFLFVYRTPPRVSMKKNNTENN